MLRTFVTSVRELRGHAVADAIVARVRPEIRDGLRLGAITTDGWYPIEWYAELHRAAFEELADPDFARAVGREGARQDFKGVYRFFAMILAPQTIMQRADRIYRMFWDDGRVEVVEARDGHAKLHFKDCRGRDANLWNQLAGAIEMMGELGGGKDVKVTILAGGSDDSQMLVEATWR
jgi:hypothetical protein